VDQVCSLPFQCSRYWDRIHFTAWHYTVGQKYAYGEESPEAMRVASREVGLEGNAENIKHLFHVSRTEYRTKLQRKDRQSDV